VAVNPRTPCVIGVAQCTIRPPAQPAPEPLELWADVCRQAAADSGASGDVLAAADSLSVTFLQSWRYDDPALRLAESLALPPGRRAYSGIGGMTGVSMLAQASEAIVAGEVELAVLCGAEALATLKGSMLAGKPLAWSHPHPEGTMYFPPVELHPGEVSSGVATNAPLAFGLFDSARRAHLGVGLDDYLAQNAEMLASMTTVAERNPHAWFPRRREATFLETPSAENRMVAYPYTKHMVAIMEVDMAAAVIVASTAAADRLGVPIERRVYPRGWCEAKSPASAAAHPDLWETPAMRVAGQEALTQAGIGIDEVAYLDFYSCFASTVNLAADALRVNDRPGDRLTVTGGLPYAGGPGSNYVLHSIASMTDVLRDEPDGYGMVSGIGMLMEKHAYCVLGSKPPPTAPAGPAADRVAASLDGIAARTVVTDYAGPATVAAYSVAHDRNGPAYGIAVCDVPDGARTYARFEDAALMADAERNEMVGQKMQLTGAGHHSTMQA
jgi:acetyl-CoA C-acetyltransferase